MTHALTVASTEEIEALSARLSSLFRLSLSSIKFGHDVITYGWKTSNEYYVETAYIPSSMKDIRAFLISCDSKASMTIYYEGTEDEWDVNSKSNIYGKYRDCDIFYNYEY